MDRRLRKERYAHYRKAVSIWNWIWRALVRLDAFIIDKLVSWFGENPWYRARIESEKDEGGEHKR